MAEVGVLNLTIQDNSSKAAGGLTKLANALDRVKGSVGGLNLGHLSDELGKVRQAIADQKGASSTITKIAGLFNAINKYATGFGKANIDTQPIVNLATAIQTIDTGKLREFTQIVSDFGTGATDKGLNNMSSAMQNVASSMERISNAVPKNDIGSEFRDIVRRNRDDQKSSLMKLNLQQFAEKKPAYEQTRMDLDGLLGSAGNAQALQTQVMESMKKKNEEMERIIINPKVVERAKESIDQYTNSIGEMKKETANLGAIEEKMSKVGGNIIPESAGPSSWFLETNYSKYRDIITAGKDAPKWAVQNAKEMYGFDEKVFRENETYAEALKAVEAAAKAAAPAVEQVGKKAAEANIKAGELIEKVTVPARVDNIGDHVDQALTSANEKATQLVEKLSSPVDASKVAGSVEQAIQSVGEKTKEVIKTPALNEQSSLLGPFATAEEEISHYRQLLDLATRDLNNWEETYSKTQRAIKYNGATEERSNMLKHSEDGFYKEMEAIEKYESYISRLEAHIDSFVGSGKMATLADQINNSFGSGTAPLLRDQVDSLLGIGRAYKSAEESASAFINAPAINESANSMNNLNTSFSLARVLVSILGSNMNNLSARFKEFAFGTESLSASMKKMFPTLTGLAKRFGNLIKYRILRTVISHISKGFTEGVQNVYQYSKAVGTSLAPAMDSASSAFALFKNSIGAAVAPLIQAFIPVINQVISVVVTVINYLNQFFALLGGQASWTRAVPQTVSAFDKQKKAAGGAGKAMKDLLADWDELNIIQSQSGGGGGGGGTSAAEDYLNMFEEVNKFESKIKDIVDFIRDNFDLLKQVAIDIGAAILGWKISNAFGGVLSFLGNLAVIGATIDIAMRLTDAFGKQFAATGDIGWFIADALTGALGPLLAGSVAKKLLGSSWGMISAGFTLLLEGTVNLKNSRSAFIQQAVAAGQMLAILGSVQKGIGAALVAGGFTASAPLALAIGGATAVYSYVVNALAAVNVTGIKWGENTLSPEEVKEFVKTKMLDTDIDAAIKITRASIELAEGEEANLSEQATGLLKDINAIKLGVDVDASLEKIKEGVFGADGLIAKFKTFASSQNELVKTAETYTPTINADGTDISKEITKSANSAWTELNGLMDGLGADLSRHLTRAMDTTLSDELRQFEMNAVTEITDVMIRVSTAGKRAATGSDALTSLKFNIDEASSGTFGNILDVFKEYRENLEKEERELKQAEASSFATAAAEYQVYAEEALKKAGGNTNDKTYQYYKSKVEEMTSRYKEIVDNISGSVAKSVDEAIKPGKELIRKALMKMLSEAKELRDGRVELFTGGKIKGLPVEFAGGLRENTALAMQNLVFNGMNEGLTFENEATLTKYYKEWLDAVIKDFFPDDFNFIKEAIDLGALNYSDIFDPEALFQYIDNNGYSPFYRQMWEHLFGEEATKAAEEAANSAPDINAERTVNETVNVQQTVEENTSDVLGGESPFAQAEQDLNSFAETTGQTVEYVNTLTLDDLQFDPSGAINGAHTAASAFEDMAARIRVAFESLNGLDFSVGMSPLGFMLNTFFPTAFRASGGPVRSGDLVMANENGNFEMMGRMGNQPVVANNQQIVQGISNGVAQANGDVVGELRTLTGLMQRMLQKEFVAKAVPGSGWARMNDTSNAAYSNISGNA